MGMRDGRMRWLTPLLLLPLACSGGASSEGDGTYLNDAAFRRHTLEASLVNPSNGYGTLRLAHYDSGDDQDWSRLPISNPRVQSLDENGNAIGDPVALDLTDSNLGEEAFFRYPVEIIGEAYASPNAAKMAGFWIDASRGLGGIVKVTYDNGLTAYAMTCSSCHAREDGGTLTVGVGNSNLDLGWGPGRLDVTTNDGGEPVAISDIRPTKFLTYLHHDGNVMQKNLDTLAVRIETLIITQRLQALRPPREVALALATYVWSLADTLSPVPSSNATGADIFRSTCASCHDPDRGFTGAPVPIAEVKTDPTLGLSSDRGTGKYRVPSLRGVGQRGVLLHDASITSLSDFMNPARGGGHPFGLSLDPDSRSALVSYLSSL